MGEDVKVAREVAESELERFLDAMEIDLDPEGMSEEDIESRDVLKRSLLKAMMRGRLVINEAGEPVYTPAVGDHAPITFHEWEGADLSAAKSGKDGAAQTNAVLGAITKTSAQKFARMKGRDWTVCANILNLFLQRG